jgi:YihY family inner membrane protein
MNIIQKNIQKLDRFQRRHRPVAFTFAVIKKFGEDDAGYKAALLTYYAFLSLFPLLLILTTITDFIAASHPEIQAEIVKGATNYIPVLGNQLAEHVGGLHKNGPALIIGLLFTLYGARGVADALKHGVQHIWGVPKDQRQGFPKSMLNSLSIIVIGGTGFIFAAVVVGIASSAGHGAGVRLLSIAINLALLFCLFTFLINVCLPRHVTFKETRAGALTAAIGLVILQILGGYLLTRELKNLDALYSYFALSLGLLFWIYLQAQIIFYAVEVAAVKAKNDWPRSLSGSNLTSSDKCAAQRLKFDV